MSKKKLVEKITSNITVDPNMRDYSKDPYFVKKAEEAEAKLKIWGFPASIKNRRK